MCAIPAWTSRPHLPKDVPAVPAFEIILRRPQVPDKILYRTRAETAVGDLVKIKGRHWLVVLKEPPFEQRRIERLVLVPRKVRTFTDFGYVRPLKP